MSHVRRMLVFSGLLAVLGVTACAGGSGLPSTAEGEAGVAEQPSTSNFTETAVWGGESGDVQFAGPNGLTIDPDGHVYSTEFQGGHLRKFTAQGQLELETGGAGSEPGMLANPIGVAVAEDGSIYVSESGSSRVTRFNPDGTFHSAWGSAGNQPGEFLSAMGIAVAGNGEVFVADFGNHRVQVFSDDGVFIREWGAPGTSSGQFANPIGVQIGPAGNVWVVDSGNERVQVFSPDGELQRLLDDVGPEPQIISINDRGEFYVSSPWGDSQVRHSGSDGELLGFVSGELSGPHGTATGPSGLLYVADTANGVIRVFTSESS